MSNLKKNNKKTIYKLKVDPPKNEYYNIAPHPSGGFFNNSDPNVIYKTLEECSHATNPECYDIVEG